MQGSISAHLKLLGAGLMMLVGTSAESLGQSDGHLEAPTHPELRGEILDLYEQDQAARRELLTLLPEAGNRSGDVQLENPSLDTLRIIMRVKSLETETTDFMKSVLDEHGYPTISMVGEEGAHAAWTLIQHADSEPAFQERALALMTPLVDTGEVDPSDFAHLTDRVLLARGEKQRFATQFKADDNGVLRPRPLEAPESLAERRAEYGLIPLERHVEILARELDARTSTEPLEVAQ